MIEVLFIISLFMILYAEHLEGRRKELRDRLIVEGIRCVLSVALADPFMDDKKVIVARNKYIRSTINLLDCYKHTSSEQVSDQVANASKKVGGQ